jgi:hypothetical protein
VHPHARFLNVSMSLGMLLSFFSAAMMAEHLGLGSAFTSNGLLRLARCQRRDGDVAMESMGFSHGESLVSMGKSYSI